MIIKYIFIPDKVKGKDITQLSFLEMLKKYQIDLSYAFQLNSLELSFSIAYTPFIDGEDHNLWNAIVKKPTDIEKFQERIKLFISDNKDKFEVINMVWNDACFELSKIAYPEIYTIENNMRELITRVMLKNFGNKWETKYIPPHLKSKSDHKKYKQIKEYPSENILFYLDFIDLSDFLFKEYPENTNLFTIPKYVNSAEKLEQFVPKSNWKRCFNKIITNVDDFKGKWRNLYNIRCKVAHNRMLTKDDMQEFENLIGFLQNGIDTALMEETPSLSIEEKIAFIKYHISLILKDDKLKELVENCGNVCESHGIPKKDSEEDDELNFMNSISPHIALLQTLKEYTQKMDCIDDRKLFNNLKAIYSKIAALFFDEYIDYAPEISDNQEIKKHYNSYTKETETFFSTIPEEITEVIERLNRYYLNRKYRDE